MGEQLAPDRRVEQNEQREQLQSARKHVEHQHVFGNRAEEVEVCRRAYQRKTRTDVVDGCGNRREIGDQIMPFKGKGEYRSRKDNNKRHDVHVGRADNFMLDRLAVHLDLGDDFRMDIRAQLFDNGFARDEKTRNLDAAAGTACAGTAEHQHDKNCLTCLWPQVEIRRGEAGGRDNRTDLKGRLCQCVKDAGAHAADVARDKRNRSENDDEIGAHFFHAKCLAELVEQNKIIRIEIDAE